MGIATQAPATRQIADIERACLNADSVAEGTHLEG